MNKNFFTILRFIEQPGRLFDDLPKTMTMLKSIIPILVFLFLHPAGQAQQIDSIFFNLYTDSLKKGTYNYINVDGRYSSGRILPLTDKELRFTASGGKFHRNSLYIDSAFRDEKLKVRATLISNPAIWKEIVIYLKKHENNEKLKTLEEVLNQPSGDSIPAKKKKKNKLKT